MPLGPAADLNKLPSNTTEKRRTVIVSGSRTLRLRPSTCKGRFPCPSSRKAVNRSRITAPTHILMTRIAYQQLAANFARSAHKKMARKSPSGPVGFLGEEPRGAWTERCRCADFVKRRCAPANRNAQSVPTGRPRQRRSNQCGPLLILVAVQQSCSNFGQFSPALRSLPNSRPQMQPPAQSVHRRA